MWGQTLSLTITLTDGLIFHKTIRFRNQFLTAKHTKMVMYLQKNITCVLKRKVQLGKNLKTNVIFITIFSLPKILEIFIKKNRNICKNQIKICCICRNLDTFSKHTLNQTFIHYFKVILKNCFVVKKSPSAASRQVSCHEHWTSDVTSSYE